ncbi:dihydrodipicolinate synthase family protein [Natronosalvus caseinilyticus]|uniref:dihydrodipicolinate synthase family protein n=1 Tax=Natronosalvus caseinilyticus TaxID=2953747 RepID=UPI0028AE87AF|nr:dihydrodipicolinate synthase family protein [Natronosalvus caseinilyticus]
MTFQQALEGVTCPIVTPFDESGSVDEESLGSLVDALLEGGIDGLFPCGTTGEFASLSPDEQRRVVEVTVERADGEVPVLAGAAATSVVETVDYAEAAAEVGADVAVVVPPYFHSSNDPDGNRRFFETVADESPLPLVLYNIPSCTGQPIALETLEAIADHENVVGLKDSSGDFEYFLAAMRRTPEEFLCLQGFDTLLVPSLRMGADGGVNALSNVAPEAYAEVLETAETGRGEALQASISGLFEACGTYGFAPATKAALGHRGWLPSDAVRPPLVAVPEAGRKTITDRTNALLEG